MSPARKTKKAAKKSRPARPPARKAKPKAKAAKKPARAKAGKPKAASAPAKRHCVATDPFGDPCQSVPRMGSKYCTIHSYLDR